jgi:hypothetical protein
MSSMFHSNFFGQYRLGSYAFSSELGQDTPSESDAAGLASGIESFIKQLPPELLGTYNAKYQACQAKISSGNLIDIGIGGKCMYDLYKELRDLVKNGPPKPAMPVVAPSGFPYLPVAIGVVGLGVLVYAFTKV